MTVRVTLDDGTAVSLRPAVPADAEPLAAFWRLLSAESRYSRFFTSTPPTITMARRVTAVNDTRQCTWVARIADRADDRIIGESHYVAIGNRLATVGIAVTVADGFQGRGLGSVLLEAAAVTARNRAHRWATAEVLTANVTMRGMLQRRGALVEAGDDHAVVRASFALPRTSDAVRPSDLHRRIAVLAARTRRPHAA
jgi:GNAT superfamily N-acetyltransferase